MRNLKEELGNEERKKTMILHKLKLFFKKKDTVYCIVEGKDDIPYYYTKISSYDDGLIYDFQDFSGRSNVLICNELVEKSPSLQKFKALFFVDKDFNVEKISANIYETPCYAIENFYVSSRVVYKILKFGWSIDEEVIKKIISMYENAQKEYHLHSLEINAFMKLQREKERINMGERKLQLNNIKLASIYNIELERVVKMRSLNDCITDISEYYEFTEQELDEIKNTFEEQFFIENFRGKNELFFFKEYLKLLKDELGKRDNRFNKRYKISGNVDEIMSTFAQYAECPENLKSYFKIKLS